MQGFRDQIARQYNALVAQTQLEPTIEEPSAALWLSTSTDDFLTPGHSETSTNSNWLELGEYNDDTLLVSKGRSTSHCRHSILFSRSPDESKNKHDSTSPNPSNEVNLCGTLLFTDRKSVV